MRLTLPDFRAAQVLVVGDLMLDRDWSGNCSRISPEAPVPVVRIDDRRERRRPGGAGNVALNLAALGVTTRLVGAIGNDAHGRQLRDLLDEAGVACYLHVSDRACTVSKLRVLSHHQQLIRLDFEQGFDDMTPAQLAAQVKAARPSQGVVVLSDYGKGTLRDPQRVIRDAQAAGLTVLVDPKGRDFDRYRGADIVTPNRAEFEAVAGVCRSDAELVERGQRLRDALALEALLVTRSEQGMTLLCRDAEPLHLSAYARQVFDVTGAGDTVIAVLAAGRAAGMDWASATRLANLAASLAVARRGAATVSVAELAHALQVEDGSDAGVLDEAALLTAVTAARQRGERIVMTNGCFDVLHAGHVAYLQQAKALGDRLIVAVNDDASVRRLGKGAGRPFNTLDDRMAVLAGLAAVDWVTPFAEDTPARLIGRIAPDVLAKGGDYRPDEIAGGDGVVAAGGAVRVLDWMPGRSTTGIVAAIRAAAGCSDDRGASQA